jgi:hypothetical protein
MFRFAAGSFWIPAFTEMTKKAELAVDSSSGISWVNVRDRFISCQSLSLNENRFVPFFPQFYHRPRVVRGREISMQEPPYMEPAI